MPPEPGVHFRCTFGVHCRAPLQVAVPAALRPSTTLPLANPRRMTKRTLFDDFACMQHGAFTPPGSWPRANPLIMQNSAHTCPGLGLSPISFSCVNR